MDLTPNGYGNYGFDTILAPFWPIWGAVWVHFVPFGGPFLAQSWARFGGILEPFWGALRGALLNENARKQMVLELVGYSF